MVKALPRRQPVSVTITAWLVFLLGIANVWRAAGLARQSDMLLSLGSTFDPRLRLGLALMWALLFAAALFVLWRRWALARLITPALALLYGLYQLGLIGLFYRSEAARRGWLASAGLYLALFGLTTWLLNRRGTRRYFRVGNGHRRLMA
jgi:hypothetical protein